MEKFVPQSPDPFLNQDADMSLAKFGHINAIVEVVTELQESPLASLNLETVLDEGNTTSIDIAFEGNAGILLENTSRLREGTLDSGAGGGIAQICAVGYELKWEAGSQYVMDSNGLIIREVNHKFTSTPTVTNDSTEGFDVGSRWILDDGTTYVCSDASVGAAVWNIVGATGSFTADSGELVTVVNGIITSIV